MRTFTGSLSTPLSKQSLRAWVASRAAVYLSAAVGTALIIVLWATINAQLKGGMTFRAVHGNCDCQQVVADRQFAAGKDRPGRDGELIRAPLTAEDLAGLVAVGVQAAAAGANRLTLGA